MASVRRQRSSIVTSIVVVCVSAVVLAYGAADFPEIDAAIVPLATFLLFLMIVCKTVRPEDDYSSHRVLILSVVAFTAHFAIGWVISRSPTLVNYLGGDALTYDQGARMIVAHWHDATAAMPPMGGGKEGFYYVLAALYWAVGSYPVAGLALNAFFAASLVPILHDLTGRLFGPRSAWLAVLIVTFQPGFLVWTSQLMREAGVIFFLAVSLNCVIRLADRATPGPALVWAACLVLLLTFRADVAVVAAGGLGAGLVFGRRRMAGGLLSTLIVLVMVVMLVGAVGLGRSGYRASTAVSLQAVSQARSDLAGSASSGFDQNANVSSIGDALRYLPRGLPSFLLGPFPWQLRNVRQLLGWLEALTVLGLLVLAWRGWRVAGKRIHRKRLILAVPSFGLAISLALLIGNYGTVVRERLQVLVFLVPLAAIGARSQHATESCDSRLSGSPGSSSEPSHPTRSSPYSAGGPSGR